MDRSDRLRLVSRICYYLAALFAAIAAVTHLMGVSPSVAHVAHITGRNELEAAVLLLLISIASEARAMGMARTSEAAPPVVRAKTA